jgi:hypothetical protein
MVDGLTIGAAGKPLAKSAQPLLGVAIRNC